MTGLDTRRFFAVSLYAGEPDGESAGDPHQPPAQESVRMIAEILEDP